MSNAYKNPWSKRRGQKKVGQSRRLRQDGGSVSMTDERHTWGEKASMIKLLKTGETDREKALQPVKSML